MSESDLIREIEGLKREMDQLRSLAIPRILDIWVPTFTGLTVVGTPTYTGIYVVSDNLVKFIVSLVATTSLESTKVTTYIDNLPFASAYADALYVTDNFVEPVGIGFISGARAYLPTWGASGHIFYVSGTYIRA